MQILHELIAGETTQQELDFAIKIMKDLHRVQIPISHMFATRKTLLDGLYKIHDAKLSIRTRLVYFLTITSKGDKSELEDSHRDTVMMNLGNSLAFPILKRV